MRNNSKTVVRLLAIGAILASLSGCGLHQLIGNSGMEYACRYNPITASETKHEFNAREIRFGRDPKASLDQGS